VYQLLILISVQFSLHFLILRTRKDKKLIIELRLKLNYTAKICFICNFLNMSENIEAQFKKIILRMYLI